MKRDVRWLAAVVIAAGIVHAVAGRALAAVDPIRALLEHHGAGVIAAAIAMVVARLFLFFVAPGWAAYVVATSVARAIYMPPK